MRAVLYTCLFLTCSLFASSGYAQEVKITGTVRDTSNTVPLKNAVVMAIRLTDSVLVSYTRTAADGSFSIPRTPVDTFQVIIQYPGYGDREYLVVASQNNREFDFGNIIMPLKSNDMKEVVIYGYKEAIYFKGDTIIYTADSFKVKENANVEDLLKKLPGVEVARDGSIKSRGKAVAQVLIDGDEFFGTDPTMATKNLYAESIESVQIYDKPDESIGAGSSETITVMDLKLKENAKKGYFGKVSGGTDFSKFYETEAIANRFNNKQKISVFGLATNTPKATVSADDAQKYGVESDNFSVIEGEEDITYYTQNHNPNGYPVTNRFGFYYNDKPTEKSKLNANYSYKENRLRVDNATSSQYFLPDTSYTTDNNL
ncbi:MAG: carboxypeptidase-like regulatory domain-containing protein, partial [Bacteroidota bacterium]